MICTDKPSMTSRPDGRQGSAHLTSAHVTSRGDMKVIATIAADNEADIIGPVIRALDQEGVLSYLIDNCSTDRTRAIAEPFMGHGL